MLVDVRSMEGLAASRTIDCKDATASVEVHAKSCRTIGSRAYCLVLKDGWVVSTKRNIHKEPVGVATYFFERLVPTWGLLPLCEANELRNDAQETGPRGPEMVAMKTESDFFKSSFKPFVDFDG